MGMFEDMRAQMGMFEDMRAQKRQQMTHKRSYSEMSPRFERYLAGKESASRGVPIEAPMLSPDDLIGTGIGKAVLAGGASLAALLGMMKTGTKNVPSRFRQSGQIAYHGSPHKFDKFRMDKIGTGEGAQAYGHGLYLAESPVVATEYQQAVSNAKAPELYRARSTAKGAQNDIDQITGWLSGSSPWPNNTRGQPVSREFLEKRLKEYQDDVKWSNDIIANREENGILYKTDIPDEAVARFLDWDKPLSQQAPEVQAALKRRITDVKPVDGFDMGGNARLRDNRDGAFAPDNYSPWILEATGSNGTSKFGLTQKDVDRMFGTKDVSELTGEQIISRLAAERGGQGAASEYLRSINVPGIRYLDGGSRSAGQGSSNFVVFDPEMIRILERNGQATGKMPWKPNEFDIFRDTTYEPPLFRDTTR